MSLNLRCCAALKMLKLGFPTRLSYSTVYDLYGHILQPPPSNMNHRNFCEAVLGTCGCRSELSNEQSRTSVLVIDDAVAFGVAKGQYQLGLTKVTACTLTSICCTKSRLRSWRGCIPGILPTGAAGVFRFRGSPWPRFDYARTPAKDQEMVGNVQAILGRFW